MHSDLSVNDRHRNLKQPSDGGWKPKCRGGWNGVCLPFDDSSCCLSVREWVGYAAARVRQGKGAARPSSRRIRHFVVVTIVPCFRLGLFRSSCLSRRQFRSVLLCAKLRSHDFHRRVSCRPALEVRLPNVDLLYCEVSPW